MDRMWIIVGTGGFLGSVLRYLMAVALTRWFPSPFPWGTFVVNVVGSLIIGLVFGFSQRYNWADPAWRLFLATGFCGGFTTFSAFAMENVQLLQAGSYAMLFTYVLACVALCLLAVVLGLYLAQP